MALSDEMHQLLAGFSLADCKETVRLLQKRIAVLRKVQVLHPEDTCCFEGAMPDRPLDEFDLKPKTKKLLQLHGIHTAGDITAAGFKRIALLRQIGPATVEEIKRVVFGKAAGLP